MVWLVDHFALADIGLRMDRTRRRIGSRVQAPPAFVGFGESDRVDGWWLMELEVNRQDAKSAKGNREWTNGREWWCF